MGRPRESTLTEVSASTSAQLFLDVSPRRDGGMIYNDSNQRLYIALSDSVSTSLYTIKMEKQSYYEFPERWQGQIWGIWAGANGSAKVTEFFI